MFGFDAIDSYVRGMHFKSFDIENITVVRYSGPFGDKLISGGYLSKFLLINLLYLYFFKNEKKIYYIFFSIITFLCLLFAGERTSLFYSICLYFVIILFWKKKIIKKIYFFLIFIIILLVALKNENFYKRFIISTSKELNILEMSNTTFSEKFKSIRQISHFNSGLEIAKKNILFGNGFKSYRVLCDKSKFQCSTHPHNFIIEIIVENGMIGLILLAVYFLILVRKVSISSNNDYIKKILYFWILFTFLPLYPTGSIFNNHYASQMWFCFGVILVLIKSKDYLIFDLKK